MLQLKRSIKGRKKRKTPLEETENTCKGYTPGTGSMRDSYLIRGS